MSRKTTASGHATFSFSLTESYREQSKDSHEYSKTYSLKSDMLHYEYVYKGFPDDKNERKEMPATASMISAIKGKIKALSLCTSYEKTYLVDGRGYLVRNGRQLVVHDGDAHYSISVTGGSRPDIKDEMYDKLTALYTFVTRFFQ